jgi:hypothetical protein
MICEQVSGGVFFWLTPFGRIGILLDFFRPFDFYTNTDVLREIYNHMNTRKGGAAQRSKGRNKGISFPL